MSGSRFHAVARGGRSRLDLSVAALAGFSVAFLTFAAPADLLGGFVASTGLPSITPAAEPPLGFKARIGLGLFGAVAIFALAFVLLRWLDRFGRSAASEPELVLDPSDEAQTEAPPRRRRDFHPDAPARRPLLAAHELGEPDLNPWAPAEPAPVAESEPVAAQSEPVREIEIEIAAPELDPLPPPSIEPVAAARPSIDRAPAPAPRPQVGSSIPELMARLEQGLARRRAVPSDPPAASPTVFPEARDDRLQSAIESLQRLATRQG
jgi:hypothetical protein